jgi:hypothetical protein
MAIQKIFAYNTGSLISGTTQVGDIAISEANVEYSADYGGLQWWGGPDETNGYVIAHTDPSGSHDGAAGGSANLGFWRSTGLTDSDFLILCNSIPPRIGDTPFTNTSDASAWLAANGYWTSFISVTPTPTGTLLVTPTPTATITETPTNTPTLTQTPTSTDLTNITTYTISGCTSLNEFVANLGPGALAPGDIFYFEFTGGTPSGCYRIVNKINAVPTDGTTPLYFYTSCALCVAAREVTPTPTVTQTPTTTPTPSVTPTPTPTSGASGNFNVTISQVGLDVVWSGSGFFNLAALSSTGPGSVSSGFNAGQAIWAIGVSAATDTYSGTSLTYPTSFGTGGVGVTSSSGSTVGILPGPPGVPRALYVPSGYVSNTTISGSATYANNTIAGMGLSAGTYTWNFTTGGNSTALVMNIVA